MTKEEILAEIEATRSRIAKSYAASDSSDVDAAKWLLWPILEKNSDDPEIVAAIDMAFGEAPAPNTGCKIFPPKDHDQEAINGRS